jgi:hypothetical protein
VVRATNLNLFMKAFNSTEAEEINRVLASSVMMELIAQVVVVILRLHR